MSSPIEDYALLGDGETAALLNRNGSIDWLCWPRFDDDSCFAALLGDAENGHWLIAAAEPVLKTSRSYQRDTLVMETLVETAHGTAKVVDFMPIRRTVSALVRIVTGISGSVRMRCELRLRFDYGSMAPWSEATGNDMIAKLGPNVVVLRAPVALKVEPAVSWVEFEVGAGERLSFVLSYSAAHNNIPGPIDPGAALAETQEYWRNWISRFDDSKTRWPRQVRRSLLTLKAMIHAPTGGLIAAPTTSLPEAPGGAMNWDYRYCWLRDASFTLCALLNAGFHDEAREWRDWLLRAIGAEPDKLQVMYRVDGSRHLSEWEVDTLPGYRYARPVRIGNAAAAQHQIDVFGEVIDALDVARRGGLPSTEQEAAIGQGVVAHLEKIWSTRGSGVWESRGEPKHYTYSKVMAWVGLDRFLGNQSAVGCVESETIRRLTALRQTIHDEVYREGWNEGLGSFTQHYGSHAIDASLLLLPLVGFLPVDDPRMAATIATIERELSEGGLIRRMTAEPASPNEGAFLACSCWMADCLNLLGRHKEAYAQFERVLAVANDLDLLAEEYNVPARHLAGNFPQALTHLALVNTALGLSGPTLQRGGG